MNQEPINWNTWMLGAVGLAALTTSQLARIYKWDIDQSVLAIMYTWIGREIQGEWRRKHAAPKVEPLPPEEPKP